jgi:hypothetical protein
MIKESDLSTPSKGLFDDISKSYDFSIYVYFALLKWIFWMMVICSALSIPGLIFSMFGQGTRKSKYRHIWG